jgi:outer membrane protein assembly factor BamB
VAKLAGRWQAILPGMHETCSYDPETGKLLWSCRGPAEVAGCTAAFHDPFVFSSGGFPEREILAIRADGTGDVTKSHIAWRAAKGAPYVPSPLYHQDHIYMVADNGVATCLDAKSGKQLWQQRLEGAFTSSPVLAGGLLYATNEAGKTYLLEAGPKFSQVGANNLGEPVLSTPAICGGQIFLRTDRHLYCIGGGK